MADLTSAAGIMVAVTSGDTLTITLDPRIPGFQLSAIGFNLSAATVTYLAFGATEPETLDTTGMGKSLDAASDGGHLRVSSVTVGGVTGSVGAFQF